MVAEHVYSVGNSQTPIVPFFKRHCNINQIGTMGWIDEIDLHRSFCAETASGLEKVEAFISRLATLRVGGDG